MSEAEILHSLRSDLAILKLTAQVKLLGSRLEIQARHVPSHPVKYDQVARFLREGLRSQKARNHPAFTGIQMVTVMIGVEGDPRFLYNATVNLDAAEAGDRDAETMDIDSVASRPTSSSYQAETLYFDRQQEIAQPTEIPSVERDPDAETLVIGRRAMETQQSPAQAGALATAQPSPPDAPARTRGSSQSTALIVGVVVVIILILVVVIF